ncbi:MFS transporter [Yinghuangia sp. ASG 101]|uniref:MFS transporter n=1 Tax=Yinghuangia sp. ASG 101 TaxID=2896848 RepID=UPI001E29178F|nr:MFS transporter [Yinghuangia sp. ASG 101]UGQ15693.1 MFS transporter [Yinghuangia sp. ASG 101]
MVTRALGAGVLVLACAAQAMVVLDVSVVNVALPAIEDDLGFGAAALPWVVNAYGLVFAGFLLLGGRLADLYGHRRVFTAGLALFTAASLVGGLATTPGLLLAARAAQGLGAAVLAPATLTVLTVAFPEGPRRTRALAVWTAAGSVGGTAGNLVGGLLTDQASWRWILLVNVPVGAATLALVPRLLTAPARAGRSKGVLDVLGALAATGSLAAIAYALTQPASHGWTATLTLAPITAGLASLAGFLVLQRQRHSSGRTPLLPLRLFRARAVWLGNTVLLLSAVCLMPAWYFLSLHMQHTLGYTATQTALGFLPHTVLGVVLGIHLAPWAMKHTAPRTLVAAGLLIAAAGFWWQSRATDTSSYLTGILGPGVVFTTGSALFITPLTTTIVSGIAPADAGAASGIVNTAKQVGGGLGLAALGLLAHDTATTADPAALAHGNGRVFLAMAAVLTATALAAFALPARNTAASAASAEDAPEPEPPVPAKSSTAGGAPRPGSTLGPGARHPDQR